MEHPTSCLPMMIQDIAYSAPGMKLITNAPHIDAQRDVSPSSPEEFAPCLGHNGSQVATGIRSLSSVEDTLAREFFDSIIIFRSSVDKVSGCITTSDSSGKSPAQSPRVRSDRTNRGSTAKCIKVSQEISCNPSRYTQATRLEPTCPILRLW